MLDYGNKCSFDISAPLRTCPEGTESHCGYWRYVAELLCLLLHDVDFNSYPELANFDRACRAVGRFFQDSLGVSESIRILFLISQHVFYFVTFFILNNKI